MNYVTDDSPASAGITGMCHYIYFIWYRGPKPRLLACCARTTNWNSIPSPNSCSPKCLWLFLCYYAHCILRTGLSTSRSPFSCQMVLSKASHSIIWLIKGHCFYCIYSFYNITVLSLTLGLSPKTTTSILVKMT